MSLFPLLTAMLTAVSAGPPAAAVRPTWLDAGKPLRIDARAGSRHTFHVRIPKAPSLIRVSIRERGIDVRASFLNQAQQDVCEADSWSGGWNTDILLCRAPTPGAYTLRLEGQTATSRTPTLTVEWKLMPDEADFDAKIQNTIAAVHRALKSDRPDLDVALRELAKAQSFAEKRGDKARTAETILLRGLAETLQHKLKEAATSLDFAAALYRDAADPAGEARALNEAGWAHHLRGDYKEDEARQVRALTLWREEKNAAGEAATATHLGRQELLKSNGEKAWEWFDQALTHYRRVGDEAGQSEVLDYVAQLKKQSGDQQGALVAFQEALRLVAGRSVASEANARNNLGETYFSLGDFHSARIEFSKAAALAARLRDQTLEGHTRLNLASILTDFGQPAEALSELKLVITLMESAGDQAGLAAAWNNTARAYSDLGRYSEARQALTKPLEIFRSLRHQRGVYVILSSLGRLSIKAKEYDAARRYLDEALLESRKAGDLYQVALILSHRALMAGQQGELQEALQIAQEALETAESERARVVRDDLRAAYFSTLRLIYERKAGILMQLHEREPEKGWNLTALEVSEAARARELVDSISSSVDRFPEISPELLDREAKLRKQVRAAIASAPGESTEDLLAELRTVQSEMRTRSPRWAQASQASVSPHAELRQLLDDDTAVLEFLLADERSYLWVVRREGTKSFFLPGLKQITAAAEAVRKAMDRPAETWRSTFTPAAAKLSQMLLGPAASTLNGRRLAVVADGPLHAVPFSALPSPAAGKTEYRPLIADYEVVTIPSLSLLSQIRARGRRADIAGGRFALFGDPVYTAEDERVSNRLIGTSSLPSDRSRNVLRSSRFARLDYSADEVRTIAGLTGGRAQVLTGFAAAVAKVTGEALAGHDVLHFATHAVVDEDRPEMSGIALSMVDGQGRPVDGFLRVMDLYSLSINPALVVLSACDTSRGRTMLGEGVIGLTRGFFLAGADRVVSSLWQVRDQATAELMRHFYEAMLARRLAPPAALRQAQIKVSRNSRWRAPHYWAGFVSHGEWR